MQATNSEPGRDGMQAFVVESLEAAPSVRAFPLPQPGTGLDLEVRAAGLNPFDAVYSRGEHPIGKPPLPSVVGREGVGVDEQGNRFLFQASIPPFGALAPRTSVEPESLIAIRDELDDATAIGLGSAGITAFLALAGRAAVSAGDVVVILGATGAVGRIATQLAGLLGAQRVVAVGRRREVLERLRERGADATVEIRDGEALAAEIDAAAGGQVDVVLDLLWGQPARAALEVASPGARFVQVGSSAGIEAMLPANPWRTRGVSILGFSVLGASQEEKRDAYATVAEHAAGGRIEVDTECLPFTEVDRAWQLLLAGSDRKLVLQMKG